MPGVDKLDVVRKAVVKCVVDMGPCLINPENKMSTNLRGKN